MIIAVGMPSNGKVCSAFAVSLCRLVTVSASVGLQIFIIDQRTSLIQQGRHEIVKHALDRLADKVLFLDTDMTFPQDTLLRLIAARKQIVGCDYAKRRLPVEATVMELPGKKPTFGVEEVAALGTGCLLVDCGVFRKLGEPYFNTEWRDGKFVGEDYWFCERARAAGYGVWVDRELSGRIGHVGENVFTLGGGA